MEPEIIMMSQKLTRSIQSALLSTVMIICYPVNADRFAPEGIRSGSVIYYPSFNFSFGHDDNVLSQETDPVESNFTNIGAGVTMQFLPQDRQQLIDLVAEFQQTTYADSSDDDFTDGRLNVGYNYQPSDKLILDLRAGVEQLNDARTPITLGVSDSPDEYRDKLLDAEWYYGIDNWEGADTRVEFEYADRGYRSNRSVNAAKDRVKVGLSGLLRFPLAPNTRLRLSARVIDFDYDVTTSKNSEQLRGMVGIDWQASAQMLLSADVGHQNKDFPQNAAADDSDDSWELSLSWMPQTFNRFELTSSKDFDESTTAASHVQNRNLDLIWNYGWDDYLSTILAVGTNKETSINGATSTVDTTDYISLSLEYVLRETVKMNATIASTEVDSDIAGNSSDKNLISLALVAAF
ncbi:MAG: outer membrane beta-barrel protein [Gammaproteobacteria bacterium]|nr:outer membrane beta-barrel protein [Gammaproteobacteria bacterium]